MRILFFIAALAFSIQLSAQKKPATVKYSVDKATGIEHYIINPKKGERIKEGNTIFVNIRYKTSKDSVMFDSWKMHTGALQIPVGKATFRGDLMDGLKLLTAGDSAIFLISADSTFIKTFGAELPAFIDKGSKLSFTVKVDKVLTKEQLEAEQLKAAAEESKIQSQKTMEESKVIDQYIKDNNLKNVQTTASGLRYVMEKEGTGTQATAGKTVRVHYTGKLLNGTKFDSSVDRGDPLEFMLGRGQVIKGWDEGIALLKVGGKAFLIIPSELAYGSRGAGGLIAPYSPLTFEVELVEVK